MLGVTGATATSSDGSPVGVLVKSARSRATRAGIAPGDIITASAEPRHRPLTRS